MILEAKAKVAAGDAALGRANRLVSVGKDPAEPMRQAASCYRSAAEVLDRAREERAWTVAAEEVACHRP